MRILLFCLALMCSLPAQSCTETMDLVKIWESKYWDGIRSIKDGLNRDAKENEDLPNDLGDIYYEQVKIKSDIKGDLKKYIESKYTCKEIGELLDFLQNPIAIKALNIESYYSEITRDFLANQAFSFIRDYRVEKENENLVPVIVGKIDIPAGGILTVNTVAIQEVKKTELDGKTFITPESWSAVVGSKVSVAIEKVV